jgi:hypothetical protein
MNHTLFALTSPGRDYFSAMTRIAMASIRITNPNIQITIACDPETAANLKSSDDPIMREADDLLVIETPDGEAGFRNRWVKTTLRLHTTGPFLFLDSDVLVRGDLSPIFETQADIAGARNHSVEELDAQIWAEDRKVLNAMNWQTGDQVYINGGVLFYADTPKASEFAAAWHDKWHFAYRQNQRFRDQPALNAALHEKKINLSVLDDIYNCQFVRNINNPSNAIIWHYYASGANKPVTAFELASQKLTKSGIIDYEKIEAMIRCKHPWRSENFVDDLAAKRIIKRNRFDGWEEAVLVRNYQYFLSRKFYSEFFRNW